MNYAELLPSNRRNFVVRQAFDTSDVSETTRREYAGRIRHFLRFTDTHGLNRNSYLEYKRYLQGERDIQRIDQKQVPDFGKGVLRRVASGATDPAEDYRRRKRIYIVPVTQERRIAR